jgi:hypothetical protein
VRHLPDMTPSHGRARLLLRAVTALVLAAPVAACGGGAGPCAVGLDGGGSGGADGGGDTVGGPLTASAFCAAVRAAEAARTARCRGGAPADWIALQDGYGDCAHLDQLIAAGSLRYHQGAAATCVATFAPDRGCFGAQPGCYLDVLEGLLPPGASCKDDFECPANAVCLAPGETGINVCASNACVAFPIRAGDSCADLGYCGGDLTCLQGVCVMDRAAGEPCGPNLPICASGLTCGAQSTCVVFAAATAACQSDDDCLPALACRAATCQPRLAVGASCAGAPFGCVAFAACNPATRLCEAAGRPGQPCAPGSTCIGGTCTADVATGLPVCAVPGGLGAACAQGGACASHGCKQGRCVTCS